MGPGAASAGSPTPAWGMIWHNFNKKPNKRIYSPKIYAQYRRVNSLISDTLFWLDVIFYLGMFVFKVILRSNVDNSIQIFEHYILMVACVGFVIGILSYKNFKPEPDVGRLEVGSIFCILAMWFGSVIVLREHLYYVLSRKGEWVHVAVIILNIVGGPVAVFILLKIMDVKNKKTM